MALFYLSNNGKSKLFSSNYKEQGFMQSAYINSISFDFAIFRKLTVKNDNYLAVGGDFVATTGTLIYDGLLKDKSALLKIYETFTGDIPALRDHLIGNYAVIIKKENEITIFGEEYYMYDIFWLCKDGKWTISNDMYSIYSNNKDILSINKRNLLEEIYVPGILANETEINDVFRLSGDKKIVINLIDGSLSVEHVKVIWQKEYHNYRETVRNVADNLINVGNAITKTYDSLSISMTGGLDSRMYLSSILANGGKPTLLYGLGNSGLTNTKHQDLEICRIYSNKFHLPLYTMDWSTPNPIDKFWDKYANKYGMYYMLHAGSDKIFQEYENNPSEFVTFGHCGELYRNLPWVEQHKQFTFDDFVNKYYLLRAAGVNILPILYDYKKIKDDVFKKLERVLTSKTKHTVSSFEPNDNVLIMQEVRARTATQFLNFSNRISNCIYILTQHEVLSNANATVEEMKNGSFMLSILREVFPPILEVPFYTHAERRLYDPKTNTLVYPLKALTKKFVAKLLPQTILDKRHSRLKMKTNRVLYDEVENLVEKYVRPHYPNYPDLNSLGMDPRFIVKHCMYEYILHR